MMDHVFKVTPAGLGFIVFAAGAMALGEVPALMIVAMMAFGIVMLDISLAKSE